MSLSFPWRRTWILLVVALGLWMTGPEVRAQFRASESARQVDGASGAGGEQSTRVDARPRRARPAAPTSLTPTLSGGKALDAYVADAPVSSTVNAEQSNGDLSLNRRQKLFWGTLGMIVHSFCSSDGKSDFTVVPLSVLEPRERICYECKRMGKRSINTFAEGLFSSDS